MRFADVHPARHSNAFVLVLGWAVAACTASPNPDLDSAEGNADVGDPASGPTLEVRRVLLHDADSILAFVRAPSGWDDAILDVGHTNDLGRTSGETLAEWLSRPSTSNRAESWEADEEVFAAYAYLNLWDLDNLGAYDFDLTETPPVLRATVQHEDTTWYYRVALAEETYEIGRGADRALRHRMAPKPGSYEPVALETSETCLSREAQGKSSLFGSLEFVNEKGLSAFDLFNRYIPAEKPTKAALRAAWLTDALGRWTDDPDAELHATVLLNESEVIAEIEAADTIQVLHRDFLTFTPELELPTGHYRLTVTFVGRIGGEAVEQTIRDNVLFGTQVGTGSAWPDFSGGFPCKSGR